MTGRSTWWRRLGGLLAACLLVVLASAPSIDALVCQDDAAISADQYASADTHHAASAPTTAPHSGETGDICPHGHCHHFSVYVAHEPVQQVLTAFLEARSNAIEQRFPPSLPDATPERPPRV
jgi:hypothetical protein